MPELFVGLMSGTSLDGVDAALVDFAAPPGLLVASGFLPYPTDICSEALALNAPGANELERAALLANGLADLYARAVEDLLLRASVHAQDVVAIGCHGQTVRHRPDLGFSIQLGNPARLAERTGVRVVADFRSRDVAAGGHGAPLVPAYHAACFARADRHRVIVNVGGIANITRLAPGRPITGFDTGPGNMLLDAWAREHLGRPFDDRGGWAAQGTVLEPLVAAMLADPYFALAPPKSTGRDHFNRAWLDRCNPGAYHPEDVQATLVALTARSIAGAIERAEGGAIEVLVCGGGAANATLMSALAQALPQARVGSTREAGVDPDWVEAMAFAWLAREALAGRPGNLPEVTGARGLRVLGAIYPP